MNPAIFIDAVVLAIKPHRLGQSCFSNKIKFKDRKFDTNVLLVFILESYGPSPLSMPQVSELGRSKKPSTIPVHNSEDA